jgi:hypothetical protein
VKFANTGLPSCQENRSVKEKKFLVDFFLAMNFEKDYDSPFRRTNKNFFTINFASGRECLILPVIDLSVLVYELSCADFRRLPRVSRRSSNNKLSTAVDNYVCNYFLTSLVISIV